MSNRPLTAEQQDLWQRLCEFSFDDVDASRPLSARLAEEQGWTPGYAQRVLMEYRRYLFLTAVAGHVVCPSEAVDEAWHCHLLYTRSYWDDLCGEVLQQRLHHDPTRGGRDEFRKHWEMYRATLLSYERIFGEAPPRDIWPAVYERFDAASQMRQVNLRDHWLVPKPGWWSHVMRRRPGVTAAFAVPVVAVGLGPLDWQGPAFLVAFANVYFLALIVGLVVRHRLRNAEPASNDADLNPAEAACLAYGRPVSVNATVAGMLQDGTLVSHSTKSGFFGQIDGAKVTFAAQGELAADSDPLSRSIHRQASAEPKTLKELQIDARDETERIEQNLTERGFLVNNERAWLARLIPLALMLTLVAGGVAKIVLGAWRERPVAILIGLCVIALVTGLCFAVRPRRTIAGDRLLSSLKTLHTGTKSRLGEPQTVGMDVAFCAALFGATPLTGLSLEDHKKAWAANQSGGAGYSGSGCGGTGCGGGGGGGGGCGGCGGGG